MLSQHLGGKGVDGAYLHLGKRGRVVQQHSEVLTQDAGQGSGVGGEQNRRTAGLLRGSEQVLDPVQCDDGLARAGAAGDLDGAAVGLAVGDPALARVQEDTPRRERLRQHALKVIRPGHDDDPARGVGDGRRDVSEVQRDVVRW